MESQSSVDMMAHVCTRRQLLGLPLGAALGLQGSHAATNGSTSPSISSHSIGVNCFDLFYGLLVDAAKTRHPNARLRELRMHGIPFVRFASNPIYPKEWALYKTNPSKYFGILDGVVAAAEYQNVALVPSLFWNAPTISDLVGEPVSDWGRDGSLTREFMQRYTSEVVGRYSKSPAILMWEFGNEFNSYADLPNALNWWPKVSVPMGTPASRSKRDLIKATDCASAFAHFAREAKRLDPARLVGSGADIPIFRATNLALGKSGADTPSEFRTALAQLAPDPMDVLSIHLYPNREGKYFGGRSSQFEDILFELTATAQAQGKRVFIGEFGVPRMSNPEAERQTFSRLLNSIVASKVDWAALWVYDLWNQENEWSVRFDNDRAWQLDLIAQANKRAGE